MNLKPAQHRRRRRQRPRPRPLMPILRGTRGAIDLASIMVGVLVISIIGGVIAATVFAVIPWAQDNAAQGDLRAVASAEGVFAASHAGAYADLPTLQGPAAFAAGGGAPGQPGASVSAAGALLPAVAQPLAINANAAGFVAAEISKTGKVFYLTNLSSAISSSAPTVLPAGLRIPLVVDPAALWVIPDPAVHAAVAAMFDPSLPLTYADAALVTAVHVNDPAARSLEGLQYATGAVTIDIQGSSIASLTPLAGLRNVHFLYASGAAITSLAPLAGWPLTNIDVSWTPITSLAGLDQVLTLQRISMLGLGTAITDFTPLATLKSLNFIDCDWSTTTDFSPVNLVPVVTGRPGPNH